MKTFINFRYLAILILAIALAGAVVHGLHLFEIRHHAGFLLDQAHRAKEDKDYSLAISHFQEYASLEPGDTEAQAELGLLLADLGQWKAASVTLEKVLRSRPDRDDVRRRLVRVAMTLGRFSDAGEHLQQYLLVVAPKDGSLWEQLGICLAAGGEFQAAADAFGKAIKLAPEQMEAYVRLAEVLRQRLNRPQEADQWAAKLVAANPKSARAWFLAASYLESSAQEKQALEDAKKAVELTPDDVDTRLLAARLASACGLHEQARGHAQRAIELDPQRAAGYSLLAHTELQTNHRQEAIACLKRGLDKASQRHELLWVLGRLQLEEGKLDEAQKTADQLRVEGQADRLADFLQAQIEAARGHWREAVRVFDQLVSKVGDSAELLKEVHRRRAECYQRLGNPDEELAAYREAASIDPVWPPAQLGIAAVLAAEGKPDEALEQYREIITLAAASKEATAETSRAMLDMASLLILKNLRLTAAEQDWTEASSLLDRLISANPHAVRPLILRAEVLVGQNRAAEAEKVLVAARDKMPEQTELWGALIALAERRKQWDRGAQILDAAKKKFGDRAWLRVVEGRYVAGRLGMDAAPRLRELAKGAEKSPAADLPWLYSELAAMSWNVGDREQGRTMCRLACAAAPTNLELLVQQLEMALRVGDPAEIEPVLKGISEIEGQGPLWHYAQAARLSLLAEKGDKALYKQAIEHLETARRQRPGWALVPLLIARMHDQQGQVDLALADYVKAIELGQRDPLAIRRAFELLLGQQRYGEADQLVRRLVQEQGMFSPELGRMASAVSAQLDNMDRALGIARQVAAQSPQGRDQLWLGQLLRFLGRRAQLAQQVEECKAHFSEAEKALRAAVALGPDVPEAWVALVQFLAGMGRTSQAEDAVGETQGKLPAEQASLALGPCYEALGNLSEAAGYFEAVLAQHPNDPAAMRRLIEFRLRAGNLDEAERHLRTLMAGQASARADEVLWATRMQAAILKNRGGYQNLCQALEMIQRNLAAAQLPEDRQEKAFLLAAMPRRAERQEAIKILEKLLKSQPYGLPEARLTLAQLYLAQQDWPQAGKQMRALMSSHGNEPRYVAAYVSLLLEHNELQEAELWLQRLEQFVPSDFTTIQLKAATMVRRGQIDEATGLIAACLAKPPAGPDAATRLGLAANFFDRASLALDKPGQKPAAAKLAAEAERLYREQAKLRPERELMLVGFLARQGRFEEALASAEKAWPQADPVSIARAGTELLQFDPTTPAHLARLENIVHGAVEKYRRAPLMLSLLADVNIQQARYQEAERLYQEVLSRDKSNYVAMNNLALLLALQNKEPEKARQLLERAMEIAGPLPAILDSRGLIRLAMGELQEALADFDAAIREEAKPARYFHRFQACSRLGQDKAAADALREARKRGLKLEQLHPLEREECRRLLGKL